MKLTTVSTTTTYDVNGIAIDKTGTNLGEIHGTGYTSTSDAKAFAKAQAQALGGKPVVKVSAVKNTTELVAEIDITLEDLEARLGVQFTERVKETRRNSSQILEDIRAEFATISYDGNYYRHADGKVLTTSEMKQYEVVKAEMGGA